MGRYYHGTISGKWGFGVLESSTPNHFHPDGRPKTCYNCPMGNEDNDDWIEYEGDDDPRIHSVPEADWTEAQKYFMDLHEECFAEERPCCGQEREDYLFYNFSKEDDYEFVCTQLANWGAKFHGRAMDYAKLDFNELAEATGDEFGDDNETYIQFDVAMPEPIAHWPSYGMKMAYFIFPYAMPLYTRALPAGAFLPADMPDMDRTITGNPLQPVCCQCRTLVKESTFHKKKRVCSEWEFDRVSNFYNPFIFQGEEWSPGKRFTTSGPFFCGGCAKNWFWDELEPKDTRQYYYHPNIHELFIYDILAWSFGEQLRQALAVDDVHIESEC
jgi:hypothetical protein